MKLLAQTPILLVCVLTIFQESCTKLKARDDQKADEDSIESKNRSESTSISDSAGSGFSEHLNSGQRMTPDAAADAGIQPTVSPGTLPKDETRCTEESALRCVSLNDTERERCEQGAWVIAEPCDEAQVCDLGNVLQPGICVDRNTVCQGSSSTSICRGEIMHQCNDDAISVRQEKCASMQHCQAGLSVGTCAICLSGEHRCDGANLEKCNDSGSGFIFEDACESEALCDAYAGFCSSKTCSMVQCNPHASCTVESGEPVCKCHEGYDGDGKTCSDVDECATNPCDVNATCTNVDGSFICQCDTGYAGGGTSCADINECTNSPCSVYASCTNMPGSYSCTCNPGFDGDGFVCTMHDHCSPNPCVNGTCLNNATGFSCDCSKVDYTGQRCENKIDDCATNPCLYGGTCIDLLRAYRCECEEGYYGANCGTGPCVGVTCDPGWECIPLYAECMPVCHPDCPIGQPCNSRNSCASECCGGEAGESHMTCKETSWCHRGE